MLPPSCSLSHSFALFSSVIQFCSEASVHIHTHTVSVAPAKLKFLSTPSWQSCTGQQCVCRMDQDGYGMRAPRPRWKAAIVQPQTPSGAINYGPWSKALSQKKSKLQIPSELTPLPPHYSTKTLKGLRGTSSFSPPPLCPFSHLCRPLMKPSWVRSGATLSAVLFFQEFTLGDCREGSEREREKMANVHRGVFPPFLSLFKVLVAFVQVSRAHSYSSTFICSSWLDLAKKSCNRQLMSAARRKKRQAWSLIRTFLWTRAERKMFIALSKYHTWQWTWRGISYPHHRLTHIIC